jgi:hypothetical protein
MTIKVVWLSYYAEVPAHDYWDMTMLKDIFSGKMWNPVWGYCFDSVTSLQAVPEGEGAIVIIPARYHYRDIDRINSDLARFPWLILMIVGDEESTFPTDKIQHPNMKLWVMTPIPGRHKADHFLPHGYTPDTRKFLSQFTAEAAAKSRDWFFSGQITHPRREACAAVLRDRIDGIFNPTACFAQGMSHEEYYKNMAMAKVIPCPSGPATPDSFRVIEALEAGCVPVADNRTSDERYPVGYWDNVFGRTPPFWIINDWESFPGYAQDIIENWQENSNKVFAWWQQTKRKMVYDVVHDLDALGNVPEFDYSYANRNLLTVLVPTSPIPSHPDTAILEETIKSIRHHLEDCEIIIMFDGIRTDQQQYKGAYEEYIRRVLWKCNYEWTNVLPWPFKKHSHQAQMTREALTTVHTPLILFVEHDTPLITDHEIPWFLLYEKVLNGDVDLIRFHYDTRIYDEHQPLMMDKKPVMFDKVPLIRTIQWSQRPHIASKSFYTRILRDNFSPDAVTMIEDRMHSVVQIHYAENPVTAWNDYRLAIFAPDGYMQRSYHLDGRKSDSKFEEQFKY